MCHGPKRIILIVNIDITADSLVVYSPTEQLNTNRSYYNSAHIYKRLLNLLSARDSGYIMGFLGNVILPE